MFTCAITFLGVTYPVHADKGRGRIEGAGETMSLQAFKKKYRLTNAQMRERFGAVGRISCPWGTATAFLIGSSDVFMTSDHLFHDPKRKGKAFGNPGKCKVTFFFSDQTYRIDVNSMIHGFKTNKTAYKFDFFDWAAGKLKRPVQGVAPLEIGPDMFERKTEVTVLSQGMDDFVPRVCRGSINAILKVSTINEFTTDCDTGLGSSGGLILLGAPQSPHDIPRAVVGLTYGWTDPYFRPVGVSHRAIPTGDKFVREALQKLLQKPAQ